MDQHFKKQKKKTKTILQCRRTEANYMENKSRCYNSLPKESESMEKEVLFKLDKFSVKSSIIN